MTDNNLNCISSEICKISKLLLRHKLVSGTSGNVSSRTNNGLLITPSGISNDKLCPEHIIEIDLQGNIIRGHLKPSSEWQMHTEIYLQRPEISSVIHTHSHYCSVISCTQQEIPPFHYMIAVAGGKNIRCAEYATFGSHELSQNAITALKDRTACLLANHGNIAIGGELRETLQLAIEIESLASQYCDLLNIGNAKIIPDKEMDIIIEKFKHYGQ